MSRCVHAAIALCLVSLAFGQDAPTLKIAAVELLKNPSFEQPAIQGRVSWRDGGSPTRADETKTNWSHFQVYLPDKPGEGKMTVGLTSDFARTGKQSLFVDFDKVTATQRRAHLMSDLIEIKPANTYRLSIWGRTDKKRPLTLDQRLALLKVEFEYFTPDSESQVGDLDYRTLMIPGNSKRIFFGSNVWSKYEVNVRAPRGAGWMKVTLRWETGRDQGMTDGTIYFDDASVSLVPGGESLVPLDETDVVKPEPDEDAPEEPAKPNVPVPSNAPAPDGKPKENKP
jgi:hypothetical protein